MHITRAQAARFLLARHFLLPPRSLSGPEGIETYLTRVGCIQYDPLDRVGTNPELVLQARLSDFTPRMLFDFLYRERRAVEGFDKMMSIYLRKDLPSFSRERAAARRRFGSPESPVTQALPAVRREIERRGPLSSAELELNERVDWPWAPTKLARAALESMFFWGELIIHRRERRRKYYDLATRHLPPQLLETADPFASEEEYHAWRVARRVGGIGLLPDRPGDAWLGIRGLKSRERSRALRRLGDEGQLAEIELEGSNRRWYLLREEQPLLEAQAVPSQAAASPASPAGTGSAAAEVSFLAPLDNLMWDRALIEELFGFRYRWEVYKPAAEREFGYYVLPVLYGERFVARCEALRAEDGRSLYLRNWWWEPGVEADAELEAALERAFSAFLRYLGLEGITLSPEVREQGLEDIGRAPFSSP
jgi:hypothetical protein